MGNHNLSVKKICLLVPNNQSISD